MILSGIFLELNIQDIIYYYFGFEDYEIVFVEGVLVESLLYGDDVDFIISFDVKVELDWFLFFFNGMLMMLKFKVNILLFLLQKIIVQVYLCKGCNF